MDLKEIVKKLEEYAPLYTSTDWDNVGLLVEPSQPLLVKKVLITNDLTEPVLDEAISKDINLIIAYHPAIFKPLKRLTQAEWKQRSIVKCIEKRIAVFSPHTTWDSIEGGINDWILEAFETTKIESVRENKSPNYPSGFAKSVKLNIYKSDANKAKLLSEIASLSEKIIFVGEKEIAVHETDQKVELEFLASPKGVVSLLDLIKLHFESNSDILNTLRIYDLDKPLMKNVGLGRVGYLKEPIKISDIIDKMKTILKMKTFRLALANEKTIDDKVSVLAIGAGTSTKLLNNTPADFIITGEISHHEILHEVHRGVSLIVTDHSNTERCFIQAFIKKFQALINNNSVELMRSEFDRDPLEYI